MNDKINIKTNSNIPHENNTTLILKNNTSQDEYNINNKHYSTNIIENNQINILENNKNEKNTNEIKIIKYEDNDNNNNCIDKQIQINELNKKENENIDINNMDNNKLIKEIILEDNGVEKNKT